MPLSAKARIEVYLPDLPRPAYQDLFAALEQELTYTFGGCTTIRGLEGNYLSRAGTIIRDRINLVYTDTPFALSQHEALLGTYLDQLLDAASVALNEEAILIVVVGVHHVE